MKYYKLTITAKDKKREIWLADDEDFLVQREVGVMKTSLLPGIYFVCFGGLKDRNPQHKIVLDKDTDYHEN